MTGKTKKWLSFEEDNESFLRKAGFSDVEHDLNLNTERDNRYQIDLICGIDTHVLVLECKMKDKKSNDPNIKQWIDSMNGRRQNFEKILRQNSKYKKYLTVHLVLVLSEEIQPSESERNYAKQQKVSIWDARYISSYNLYPAELRGYIPYHILGDLGAKIPGGMTYSVVAFKSKINIRGNSYTSYTFSARPSELLKYCYVARREHGGEQFYQRIINPTKLRSVGRYIEGGGSFVNNLVLAYDQASVDGELTFTRIHKELSAKANDELISKLNDPLYNVETGILQFPLDYKSFWVIDGQHRLFGYASVGEKEKECSVLPVVLISGISLHDQMKLFVDINHEQKAINADLIWDIYGETQSETVMGAISNIAKEIDLVGPLEGKIKIPSRRRKASINLSSFCRAIKKTGLMNKQIKWLVKPNPFYKEGNNVSTANNVLRALEDYFYVLSKVLDSNQYESILNSTSIEIFVALFSLLSVSIRAQDSSEKRRIALTEPIECIKSVLDSQLLEEIRKATGESLKDEQTKNLLVSIAKGTKNTESAKIYKDIANPINSYNDLEPGMREWLGLLFSEYHQDKVTFDDWFRKACPKGFSENIYKDLIYKDKNQNGYKGSKLSMLDGLTIGNIIFLLKNPEVDELFKISRRDIGTIPSDQIIMHLHFISPQRNDNAHGVPRSVSTYEVQQSKISLETLMKNIELVRNYFSSESEPSDFSEDDSE